jgi:hypothetical protein
MTDTIAGIRELKSWEDYKKNYLLDLYKVSLEYFTFIILLVFSHYLLVSFMNVVLEPVVFKVSSSTLRIS